MSEVRNKILIVEDETTLREILETCLQSQEYEADSAENGRDALVKCRAFRPDLILLDVVLPDILGIEVLETVRSAPAEYGSPDVIVMSGNEHLRNEDAKQRWRTLYGIRDFVNKPFDFESMLRRIDAVLKT
jgi:DNA-binding response OmpR family regulator